MRILPAIPEDAPLLAALESRTFQKSDYPLHLRTFRYHLAKGNLLLTARNGAGKLVGYLLALSYPKSGRIYSLAVDEAFRGKGMGKRLVEEALERFRGIGKRRVTLEVRAAAAGLISLYKKCGFREVKTLPRYYGDGVDGVKMVLSFRHEVSKTPRKK